MMGGPPACGLDKVQTVLYLKICHVTTPRQRSRNFYVTVKIKKNSRNINRNWGGKRSLSRNTIRRVTF
jgi:hypothetical protein